MCNVLETNDTTAGDAVASQNATQPRPIDELIGRLAREIGHTANECCHRSDGYLEGVEDEAREAMRLIAQLVAEECAKVCEDVEEEPWFGYENPNTFDDAKRSCAAAIRAEFGGKS